jgi:hypothetical protein
VSGLHHGHKGCSLNPTVAGLAADSLKWIWDYDGDNSFDILFSQILKGPEFEVRGYRRLV